MFFRCAATTFAALFLFASQSYSDSSIQNEWLEFQKDPKSYRTKPLQKHSLGRTRGEAVLRFSSTDIASGRFVKIKSAFRQKQKNRAGVEELAAPIARVEDFIDAADLTSSAGKVITDIYEMSRMNLTESTLANPPWSDTYWPMAKGILARRYGSFGYENPEKTFSGYSSFVAMPGNSLADIYARKNQIEIDSLSPSEKYDLLLGDLKSPFGDITHGYLTPRMWTEGRRYADLAGNVETWMGICQGWAAASISLPRPMRSLNLKAADGTTSITFYPSDFKGLASYLWAYSPFQTQFLGGRCHDRKALRDVATGRPLSEACFDVNPANWHVAIANQLGIARKSLVMDMTFDYEVWNQPIASYKYKFFNPQTGAEMPTAEAATVAREAFTNDKFARFRSLQAKRFVGISMEVVYVSEVAPSQQMMDMAAYDDRKSVTYMYDLELDEFGKIVGGEWYTDHHPDFLWKAKGQSRATSAGDAGLNSTDWTVTEPLPPFWRDIAIRTATVSGQPLAAVVNRMVFSSAFSAVSGL